MWVVVADYQGSYFGALDAFHVGDIDGYNIYAPVCLFRPDGSYYPSSYVRQQTTRFGIEKGKSNKILKASQILNC